MKGINVIELLSYFNPDYSIRIEDSETPIFYLTYDSKKFLSPMKIESKDK